MNDLIYLFAAYGVIWIIAFGFIFSMVRRQQSLQKELEMLSQLTQSDEAE